MREMSKANLRRSRENIFMHIFSGLGIDIGGFPDPFYLTSHLFPLVQKVELWDKAQGDATFMNGVSENTYDFVVSSHTLEHLEDPFTGLQNWWKIVKLNGHMVVTIPDEDLYENSKFPSRFNSDHKHTFTIFKDSSTSIKSINVIDLLKTLTPTPKIKILRIIDDAYDYDMFSFDQTKFISECAIEFVIQKVSSFNSTKLTSNRNSEKFNLKSKYYKQFQKDWELLKNISLNLFSD